MTAISASDGHPNGSSASRFREFRQLAGSPQPNGPGLIGVLAYYPGFWILVSAFPVWVSAFRVLLLFGFLLFDGELPRNPRGRAMVRPGAPTVLQP